MTRTKQEVLRRRILDRARNKFFREGIARVTMDEIAGELGMSKKTLYALFPSKHELLEAALKEFIGSIREQIDAVLGQKKSYESKFKQIVGLIRQELRPMSRIYLKDMASIEPELFDKIKAARAKLLQHCFSALLARGKGAPEFAGAYRYQNCDGNP